MQIVMTSNDGTKKSQVSKAIESSVVDMLIQNKTIKFIQSSIKDDHDRTLSDNTIKNIKDRNRLFIENSQARQQASKLADPKDLLNRIRILAARKIELHENEMTRYDTLLQQFQSGRISEDEFEKKRRKLWIPQGNEIVSMLKEMDVQSGNQLKRQKEIKQIEASNLANKPPEEVSNPKLKELTDKIMSGKNIIIQELPKEKDARSDDQASNH